MVRKVHLMNFINNHPEEFVLIAGNGNFKLAEAIGKILKKEVVNPISYFSDGEIRVKNIPNIRRRPVFVLQPTAPPVNDRVMELILMTDAARRASASEITAVVPYFGYARQDRKEQPRVPISASVVANMIRSAGADRILTVDVHTEQAQGFIKCAWDNLYASFVLIPEIKKRKLSNPVIVSPDKGGVPRATGYASLLGSEDIAIVYKQRDLHVNNKSEAFAMIGEVEGRDLILVDDMLDSGGTIFNAAAHVKTCNPKSIRVVVSHGLFTGSALQKLTDSPVEEVIVTDSIDHREEVLNHPKITVVSIAPLLAAAIERVQTGESINEGLILR